jgi:ABC-type multidrug transport system permease subunit
MRGFLHHFLMTLRLNFRNPQAVVFGYVVPVFFLFAFAAFYITNRARPGNDMGRSMGQLLTITILGGACFGLPVAVVSERERGVWRRYRLTPMPTVAFVLSMLLARYVLVLSSGLIQIGLAMWIFKMPLPRDPWRLMAAFTLVSFAFLGIGLLISMVAGSTHAVQALGQSLFLPMIIIGGVGVRLSQLPEWARVVAAFLPGRYAVQAIDVSVYDVSRAPFYRPEIYTGFNYAALAIIGAAACVAAVKLFRWENGQRLGVRAWAWGLLVLGSWVAVGLWARGHKLI